MPELRQDESMNTWRLSIVGKRLKAIHLVLREIYLESSLNWVANSKTLQLHLYMFVATFELFR